MELTPYTIAPHTQLHGEHKDVRLTAGQRLTIETSPGGAEILDAVVPAGKEWVALISATINETDA